MLLVFCLTNVKLLPPALVCRCVYMCESILCMVSRESRVILICNMYENLLHQLCTAGNSASKGGWLYTLGLRNCCLNHFTL